MVSSDLRTLVLRQSKTKEWSGSGLRNLVLSWLAAECNCKIRLASCTNERVPKVCPERFARRELRCLGKMAGTTRLELATSAVTGQRSNQLNYVPSRGINDLAQNLANKGFASFAYSAPFASVA